MDMVTTNLQQQRQITEQLRREAALKRIMVSKAVEDIMKYITEHEQEDYLLISTMFSINLVTLDSYQSTPLSELDVTFSDFRGNEIKQVPIIRIFGSTPSGIKTCLHIHGVFPYMYIPCLIDNNVDSFMYKLAAAIDSAINVSLGSTMSNAQHVYKIQRIFGTPLYGYHEKEHLFLKIYFYNPAMIKRAADLLQSGIILNQSLQPHEAHIPFILQFMIDYNLYGMSLINLKDVKFRQCIYMELKENSENNSSLNLFDSQKCLPPFIVRQSTCKLEIDAQASDILNRQEIQNGLDLNPGIATIWNEEKFRREAKGLQNPESQFINTNINDRVYGPTENDIYQEKRLIERLQSVSQINENITPVTSKIPNYPLEVGNDNSVSASHVLNHLKPSALNKENNKILLNNDLLQLEKSVITESNSLDSEDMHLLEMLANLAEKKEDEETIDNDSMLGSQFSMLNDQIKEDNEDEEDENLNITSLDLDTLSSWNSAIKAVSQSSIFEVETKETENVKKIDHVTEYSEGTSSISIPQYDGSSDLILKNKKQLLQYLPRNKIKKKRKECKKLKTFMLNLFNTRNTILNELNLINIQMSFDFLQNKKAVTQLITSDIKLLKYFKVYLKKIQEFMGKQKKTVRVIEQRLPYYKVINLYKLDHQDLDVYDVDEIEHTLTSNNYNTLKYVTNFKIHSDPINIDNLCYLISSVLNKLNVPAFDGNIDDSSSDSELDQDITINREEKRICAYKLCTKPKSNESVDISLQKRKFDLDNCNLQSPHKRRNTNKNSSQYEPYTPIKVKSIQSSRSVSKKYSSLNVKIISPKINRNIESNRSYTAESNHVTPKQSGQQLKMNLFNEKINSLVLEKNTASYTYNEIPNINETFILDDNNDSTSIHEVINNLETEDQSVLRTNFKTQVITKNNKEVRKRLNFINIDKTDVKSLQDNEDKFDLKSLSSIEEIKNDMLRESSPNNNSIMKSNYYKNSTKVIMEEDEKINYEYNLPSTSKTNVNLHLDNVLDKTSPLNEDGDESEENICNITYTQYLSKKLEFESYTSNVSPLRSISDITNYKSVTITTKFNPPSRERIIDSMKIYNILESKFNVAFFSNKVDSIKQREGTNKNNIDDIIAFKCSLNKVTGIKLWRRVKINEFYPSGSNIKSCDIKRVLAGYNALLIHPLFHPPTLKNVKTWLHARKYLLKMKDKHKKMKDNIDVIRNTRENHIHNETAINNQYMKNQSDCSNNSEYLSGSNDSFNLSLQKMLENPLLYKNSHKQYFGLSYGQIEYTLKGYSNNVENENLQNARGLNMHQYLTILSIDLHVITRDKLLPDPKHDSIRAIFYAIHNDVPLSSKLEQIEHGAIIINPSIKNSKIRNIHSIGTICPISYVSNEEDLLNSLIILVKHCDPDIIVGWEIESFSWGYIFHRASHIGFNNFIGQISRISNITSSKGQGFDKDNFSDVKIPGRIMLDVWRIMRHEIALLNYTFENVMYNVMHERISCPSFQTLSNWWNHENVIIQWRVITHYVIRVVGTLRILIHLDIIGRTCEHARLFGIQFYEVFSRGSQFRVESIMLRLAKLLNYIPVSPSMQQRARMHAPESLPLIMEPQSMFYTDPLIVLDFQSLYPSIIIAYNYCFSTCLGRIEHIGHYEPYEFGATKLKIKKDTVQKLLGKVNFAPCGVAFVKPEIRLGVLPRMLTEILNTRLMVKESMKLHGNENYVLQRVLHSQQLGLKLIANVTYGYTAANFSGRMPCIEIGDSVVSKGRETLERAIKIVESTSKWGAEVVYGDTDSLFILLRGKSRKDAFAIGTEIANTVTAANPPPVKLKFEKVLQPSILQTKKRYCGYMYESLEQEEPEYLAKGIETVRRDGCPAVAKILEKTLKILFNTKDLSVVKLYITRQFDKILRRKVSIQDLTFAKEFRGLHGYKTNACVPALELTRRLMRKDPRAVPRIGERVRYVIVAGAPNQPLIHCVRTPIEVISDEGLSPNSVYYITKVIIPPLNRCLNLIGIDVNAWYREMTHHQTPDRVVNLCTDNQKLTIRQFFSTTVCVACGNQTQNDICINCTTKPSQTITILHEKLRWLECTYHKLTMVCQSCTGYLGKPKCESLDCPVFYRLMQAQRDLVQIPYLNDIIHKCNTYCIEKRNISW